MIAALARLNVPALLERFLREVITSSYDGSENSALVSSVSVMGEASASALLSALVAARIPDHPVECVELLLAPAGKPAYAFPEVAEAAVAGIDRIGISGSESGLARGNQKSPARSLPNSSRTCFGRCRISKKGMLCDAAAGKIASRPGDLQSRHGCCSGNRAARRAEPDGDHARGQQCPAPSGAARRSSCSRGARLLRSRRRTGVWM
jgi:hypothetical protein